ncbi:nicotinic acid mononucleotide adenylyltransferase [Paenibacillus swuensis]|uniref:Probable nicotinate-nucleotide adenylyltransferase n=1 Tax=Paenibacillus swuensis TaxID=1178515 RepID=A0A172TKC4_9BACL|nr:nicotinate-nucleotide adenylyltransferase [Paenibacillus swuensis]ANE47267.1 nicotinic acid mononucleotide adenylyltransferase [Paenibacillus swuensis]
MRIGIMGGTFNPIHLGHLIAAQRACEGMELDQIWFMPTHTPPHKPAPAGTTPEQRRDMVQLAVSGSNRFCVSDAELRREGVSYSYDTVCRLQQDHPDDRFYYIVGADMIQFLPKWYRIDELATRIGFIGLQRKGYSASLEALPENIRAAVTLVPMPVIELSSTEIRERRAKGKPVTYLVPANVERYMEENGLYA